MGIFWEYSSGAGWILRSNVGSKILSVKKLPSVNPGEEPYQCHCLGNIKDLGKLTEVQAKEASLSWLCEILSELTKLTKEIPCS